MITRRELERRRNKLQKRVARRNRMKDIACGVVAAVGIAVFMAMFVDTWDKEIQAHGEYNRQYINEMEKAKAGY